jgi:hypothetical protein
LALLLKLSPLNKNQKTKWKTIGHRKSTLGLKEPLKLWAGVLLSGGAELAIHCGL